MYHFLSQQNDDVKLKKLYFLCNQHNEHRFFPQNTFKKSYKTSKNSEPTQKITIEIFPRIHSRNKTIVTDPLLPIQHHDWYLHPTIDQDTNKEKHTHTTTHQKKSKKGANMRRLEFSSHAKRDATFRAENRVSAEIK